MCTLLFPNNSHVAIENERDAFAWSLRPDPANEVGQSRGLFQEALRDTHMDV